MYDGDIETKRDGFGIGELGQVPASTPYDDMIAAELNRAAVKPNASRYTLHLLDSGIIHVFATLDEMLTYARNLVQFGTRDSYNACLFGPGHTVGDLYAMPDGSVRLTWRIPIKLDHPENLCEECGGSGDEIKNGRCTRCGESDMIVTTWRTWENHEELL